MISGLMNGGAFGATESGHSAEAGLEAATILSPFMGKFLKDRSIKGRSARTCLWLLQFCYLYAWNM